MLINNYFHIKSNSPAKPVASMRRRTTTMLGPFKATLHQSLTSGLLRPVDHAYKQHPLLTSSVAAFAVVSLVFAIWVFALGNGAGSRGNNPFSHSGNALFGGQNTPANLKYDLNVIALRIIEDDAWDKQQVVDFAYGWTELDASEKAQMKQTVWFQLLENTLIHQTRRPVNDSRAKLLASLADKLGLNDSGGQDAEEQETVSQSRVSQGSGSQKTVSQNTVAQSDVTQSAVIQSTKIQNTKTQSTGTQSTLTENTLAGSTLAESTLAQNSRATANPETPEAGVATDKTNSERTAVVQNDAQPSSQATFHSQVTAATTSSGATTETAPHLNQATRQFAASTPAGTIQPPAPVVKQQQKQQLATAPANPVKPRVNKVIRTPAAIAALEAAAKSPAISESDLQKITTEFVNSYETGNIRTFTSLFAPKAVSNDDSDLNTIRKEYANLFATTSDRRMIIGKLKWNLANNTATGEGQLEVAVKSAGADTTQKYSGKIQIVVEKQNDGVQITKLYHALQ